MNTIVIYIFYPYCIKTLVLVFWCSQAGFTLLVNLIQHLKLQAHLFSLQWPACYLQVVVPATFSMLLSICRALLRCVLCATILVTVAVWSQCIHFVSSARWHQSLWPLLNCLACFFVPFLPPLCIPNQGCHIWVSSKFPDISLTIPWQNDIFPGQFILFSEEKEHF